MDAALNSAGIFFNGIYFFQLYVYTRHENEERKLNGVYTCCGTDNYKLHDQQGKRIKQSILSNVHRFTRSAELYGSLISRALYVSEK